MNRRNLAMTLFERIKKLAAQRNKNVKEIALILGFSENLFYKWKNSEPKARDLEKVADYFDVSVDYLLGRTQTPHANTTQPQQLTVEEALASVMSSDGKPLSEHDREILAGIIEAYIEKSSKK
jgi:transcriptional regulator with XRE-family HTH domain